MSDVGLSNERTSLAWQRTALAGLAAAALATRLTWETIGAASVVPLALALGITGWLTREGSRRYTSATDRRRTRDGHAPVVLTLLAAAVGALQIAVLAA